MHAAPSFTAPLVSTSRRETTLDRGAETTDCHRPILRCSRFLGLVLGLLWLLFSSSAQAQLTELGIETWGYYASFLTSRPETFAKIAAGGSHNLGLRSNGTVIAWGDNTYGQTNVPSSATNIIAIAASGSHSLALLSNGTVIAWGDNTYGQTNVPSSATNIMAIAACDYYSLALRSNGTVIVWGKTVFAFGTINNVYRLSDVTAQVSNVIAIAAGGNSSMALYRFAPPSPPAPVPLAIVQQPQNVWVSGPTNLSVSAVGTGNLSYQWFRDGVLLPGETQPVLSLEASQPALSTISLGSTATFQVRVSDDVSQIISKSSKATVVLKVDAMEAPDAVCITEALAKSPQARRLSVVTHGFHIPGFAVPQVWVDDLTNALAKNCLSRETWQFHAIHWEVIAMSALTPNRALSKADCLGRRLSQLWASQGWEHVHLIAHSAGSALIQAAC